MKPLAKSLLCLLAAATLPATGLFADPDNPNIDMPGFLQAANEAAAQRRTHRVSEDEFIRLSREPGTIILDARSREKYDLLHVAAAINLSFPDIDIESLRRTLPDKSARVLIYCNNNFAGNQRAFASKAPAASLNLSTYVTLYSYGYRNVYELAPYIDVHKTKLNLVGRTAAPVSSFSPALLPSIRPVPSARRALFPAGGTLTALVVGLCAGPHPSSASLLAAPRPSGASFLAAPRQGWQDVSLSAAPRQGCEDNSRGCLSPPELACTPKLYTPAGVQDSSRGCLPPPERQATKPRTPAGVQEACVLPNAPPAPLTRTFPVPLPGCDAFLCPGSGGAEPPSAIVLAPRLGCSQAPRRSCQDATKSLASRWGKGAVQRPTEASPWFHQHEKRFGFLFV